MYVRYNAKINRDDDTLDLKVKVDIEGILEQLDSETLLEHLDAEDAAGHFGADLLDHIDDVEILDSLDNDEIIRHLEVNGYTVVKDGGDDIVVIEKDQLANLVEAQLGFLRSSIAESVAELLSNAEVHIMADVYLNRK